MFLGIYSFILGRSKFEAHTKMAILNVFAYSTFDSLNDLSN
jgi:hypothetical protein